MICSWDQYILDYHFSIVHQINKMMADVDALPRRFRKLIAQYFLITSILHISDKQQ